MTSLPLPSYDVFPVDLKTEEEVTKDDLPPPDYSEVALSTTAEIELPL